MRHQHRYWWQILLLALWVFVFCTFAYWIESFESQGELRHADSRPDELSAQPDRVELWFLTKDIFVNGRHLNNFELKDPLYVLGGDSGQLFFALTNEWRACLGLETDVIRADKTVLMRRTQGGDAAPLATDHLTSNLKDTAANVERGYNLILTDNIPAEAAKGSEERLREDLEAVRVSLWLDTFPWLEDLPFNLAETLGYSRRAIEREHLHANATILRKDDGTVYLPFDWFTQRRQFGWSVYVDELTGVYISTDPAIPAQSYYSERNAAFIDGLASFMCSLNRRLSYAESLYFVYLFRHEGWVSDVDPTFLMGVARNESTFRKDVIGGGAIGLMQIMPRTGAYYGYPAETLFDPHSNIEFGASYIGRFLHTYGDAVVALSAYNAGPGRVAGGDYSTAYAEHVLGHQQALLAWLANRGSASSFDEGPLAPAASASGGGE